MTWLIDGLAALARGLLRGAVALGSAVLLAVHVAILLPGFGLGLVFLVPWPFVRLRPVTSVARRVAGGVPEPYLPRPPAPPREPDGRFRHQRQLYKRAFWPRAYAYLEWVLGDRATWRDFGWMLVNPVLGGLLGFGSAAVVVAGVALAVVRPFGWWAIPAGAAITVAGLLAAPVAVRAHDRWTRWALGPPGERIGSARVWFGRRLYDLLRLLALGGLALVSAVYAVVGLVVLALIPTGLVVFLPPFARHVRRLTGLRRTLAKTWSGVPVETPYRPEPPLPPRRPDGLFEVAGHLYKTPYWTRFNQRLRWTGHDPATWRDLLWLLLDPFAGGALVLATVGGVALGFVGQVIPAVRRLAGDDLVHGPVVLADRPWLALALGLALMAFGAVTAPAALRLHGRWTAWLLAPTAKARLDLRVRQLTESRADASEAQAAELRRIERDLHDGAQARLVAMGLTLNVAESLIERDPAKARALLAEARETSAKALAELRDLVRGVHPPVLQERGLGDAVRALALDAAIPATVEADLPGRLPAPVEAAVYFAISEALANAAKHSGARRVDIRIGHDGRALRATVTDDGRGGADVTAGSGLRGMRHRLGAFDGTVRVDSPSGGPTVVTLEVPCASSSPRTSTS